MSRLHKRTITAVLVAIAGLGLSSAVVYAATTKHGPGHHRRAGTHVQHGFPPNVDRVDLSGYKIETRYTLGRNTGNTFDQTYTDKTVQGVPVEGPFVGQTFPPENYVALAIAHKTLYVAWLDPQTNAIVDAFVMNFKTHVVFDYAPGSDHPESSGTVRILERGTKPIP
jgi:hypothetical protein